MYHEYYKLQVLPFENTPDPRFFFASEHHREALAAIEYVIRLRKGFALITGDIGSGKTTVCRTMVQRCCDKAHIIQVLHGHDDGVSLIRQIMRNLDAPITAADDHASLLEKLRQKLLDQIYQGMPVVLMVDEAQNLPDAALEELRLLSNFDTAAEKLVQVVLVGHPELRDRFRSSKLAALRQRVVLAKQLRPLSLQETGQYIAHRLAAASSDPKDVQVAFDPQAATEIHRYTAGVPRLINTICDNCLLLGFVRQVHQITPALVQRGVEDMVPTFTDDPWPGSLAAPEQSPSSLRLAGSF